MAYGILFGMMLYSTLDMFAFDGTPTGVLSGIVGFCGTVGGVLS